MTLLCALPSASEVSLPEPPKLRDRSENAAPEISRVLVADVRALVSAARHRAAQAVNAELVLPYLLFVGGRCAFKQSDDFEEALFNFGGRCEG